MCGLSVRNCLFMIAVFLKFQSPHPGFWLYSSSSVGSKRGGGLGWHGGRPSNIIDQTWPPSESFEGTAHNPPCTVF